MQKFNINTKTLNMLFSDSSEKFILSLQNYLYDKDIYEFTIWNVTGNICHQSPYSKKTTKGTFDIYDFGYNGDSIANLNQMIKYFDDEFYISQSLFLGKVDQIIFVITFHSEVSESVMSGLSEIAPYLSARACELITKDKQMDLYVDYQKKVDFVKRGSAIFKALDLETVLAVSLKFFIDIFSAEVAFALYKGRFLGIGIDEDEVFSSITVGDVSLGKYLIDNKKTEYIEHLGSSSKFNIKNIFFVYEEISEMQFVLFNINVDIIPDKEFSSLVSGIVSIAVENSKNHEIMMQFKLEETEMAHTVEILNQFVKSHISFPDNKNIYGVNYPARSAGGDFVDVQLFGDKIFFCIADVCGKGYSAAVFTVLLSVFAENFQQSHFDDTVISLNRFLIHKKFNDRFITAFFGVIDKTTNKLSYISCGHDPVMIVSKQSCQSIKSDYLPLGLIDEDYRVESMVLPPDALVFAYTDGLTEYTSYESLEKKVESLSNKSAKEIINTLYSTLVLDPEKQRDDFTCIAIKL